MSEIKVRVAKTEIISFLDRKKEELTLATGRNVSRNELINMILENEMKKDLSINRDVERMADNISDLKTVIQSYVESNNALLYGLALENNNERM